MIIVKDFSKVTIEDLQAWSEGCNAELEIDADAGTVYVTLHETWR